MSRLRILLASLLLMLFVPCCCGQIGKSVIIPAGSEIDHQLTAITKADPSQKLALIDQFASAHPEPEYQIVADEQYIGYFLNAKQYDKVFEYGEKLFALDPDSYSTAVNMIRAAAEKGDIDKMFAYGEKANAIVQRFTNSSAPAGMDAATWDATKQQKLANSKDDQDYVRQSLVSGAYGVADPAKKASYFELLGKLYANTPEGDQAFAMAVASYQQAQDHSKMLEVANHALTLNPNNISVLLLLADDCSEKPDQLDKAESYANKVLSLTQTAKKPDGVPDDQWTQEISVQKGLALSTLGQVGIARKQNAQAVDSLTKAAPLLKSNPTSYARNQYRLGFAYLNLKKNPEAKQAFTDAASVDSPYKAPAQQKLTELNTPHPGVHKKPS